MKTSRVQFAGLSIVLPQGWVDVTDDIPGEPPPTLAKEGGFGVLQFSVARYRSGAEPNIDTNALREMMNEFARSRRLGRVGTIGESTGKLLSVTTNFASAEELIRVWYLTNARDVALVTYVALAEHFEAVAAELRDVDEIVGSLEEL